MKHDAVESWFKAHYQTNDHIGCLLASRITDALLGHGLSYGEVSKLVYDECHKLTHELSNGDWLEMPNGDTYIKVYSVGK